METKKSCKSCTQAKLEKVPIWLLAMSIYMLIASIYGTVQIFKDIMSLF